MKKIITTMLLTGSLISIFIPGVLCAEEKQDETIEQKAKVILEEAQLKADKLVEEAKIKAEALKEKAKADAAELKEKASTSIKETNEETKALADEAMARAQAKGHELVEKTKELPQTIKHGTQEKYIYSKEAVNKSYEKSKDAIADARIRAAIKYAFLMSENIHSMKIDVEVKDGVVTLFGKVKSTEEAEEAMLIALSTKGVQTVNSFFLIEE